MRIQKVLSKARRCNLCGEIDKRNPPDGYIGTCTKYGRTVRDCLCYCEEGVGGQVILHNFGEEERGE